MLSKNDWASPTIITYDSVTQYNKNKETILSSLKEMTFQLAGEHSDSVQCVLKFSLGSPA